MELFIKYTVAKVKWNAFKIVIIARVCLIVFVFILSLKYIGQIDPFRDDTMWMTMDPAQFPVIHNNNVIRAGKSLL